MNDPQLQRLLDLYFDKGLLAEELAELERILLSSQQARIIFWEQAHLHQALRRDGAESWGGRVGQIYKRRKRFPLAFGWRGGLAAAIAVASLITWSITSRSANEAVEKAPVVVVDSSIDDLSNSLPPRPSPLPSTVAVVSEMVGAEWDASSELHKGSAIESGEINLRSGLVGLTFFNGARVTMEGPARLKVISDTQMRLIEGNVRIECPEVANGFVVFTPGGRVIDLGTVFGLSVGEDGSTEVQVVKGLVKMRGNAESADTELHEKGVAIIEETGNVRLLQKAIKLETESVASRIRDKGQERYQKWLEKSGRRVGDEDLLVYFRMLDLDEQKFSSRILANEGGNRAAGSEAAVIAANWVEGRWPGKRAILFQNADERARIMIKGRYDKVTFSAWVKIAGFQRPFNALFMSDKNLDGEVHWQFSQRGGGRFGVRPMTRLSGAFHRFWANDFLSPKDNGVWRHLVTSYDAKKKIAVQYIDGEEIDRQSILESVSLQFGRATLGNTSNAVSQYWGPRQFGGAVDEFAIYSRVLSAEEITELYEEGLPN